MSAETKIEWTDASWSPWRGCTKVSAGCAHCYAETLSKRNPAVLGEWGKGKPRVKSKSWHLPKRWNKQIFARCDGCEFRGVVPSVFNSQPCPNCSRLESLHHDSMRVFPSLLDWLDDEVPIEWLAEFLQLIHDTPYLTWQLLTKRPENFTRRIDEAFEYSHGEGWQSLWTQGEAPANVWVGVSVEGQQRKTRIDALRDIPAQVRFLSLEPLLEDLGEVDLTGIDWIIIGGESGKDARRCNLYWIADLVNQCEEAGVPVFVKQLGGNLSEEDISLCARQSGVSMQHPKGGDPMEWVSGLRIRQFPKLITT